MLKKEKGTRIKLISRLFVGVFIFIFTCSCFVFSPEITPTVAYPLLEPATLTPILPTLTPPPLTPHVKNIYYVDSKQGSDSNPGSQTLPWRTIQKAADTLFPGDTVIVLSGTYPERVTVDGTSLSFVADDIVNMQGFEVTGNNNLISGFTIQNPDTNSGLRVSGNYNTLEHNDISNTLQDGVWFFGHDNVFRYNYIHDIWLGVGSNPDPHVDCFQTWSWDWDTYNILFEGNVCNHTRSSGSNQMVMISGDGSRKVSDITFRNNIFIMHDAGYSPFAVYGSEFVSNIKVYNNTFYNVTGQGSPAIYMEGVTNTQVINNVSIGYSHIAEITGNDNIVSNNVWSGGYGMVDYLRLDFHLRSDSPLIDAGVYVDDLATDFDGVIRPQGNGFDIGAFEYSGSE